MKVIGTSDGCASQYKSSYVLNVQRILMSSMCGKGACDSAGQNGKYQVRQEAYTAEEMKTIIKSSPGFSAPAPAQVGKGQVAEEANFVD